MGLFTTKDTVVLASAEQDIYMAKQIAAYTGTAYLEVHREYFYGGEGAYLPQILGSVRNKLAVIVASVIGSPVHGTLPPELRGASLAKREKELEMIIAAACHSQADELLLIMTYNSWVRSDKKDQSGTPYGFKAIAAHIEAVPKESHRRISVILCDLHNDSTATSFGSVDVITTKNVLLRYVAQQFGAEVVMALDTGGVKSAKKAARLLNLPHGVVDKDRRGAIVDVTGVGGVDVRGKRVLAVEDEIARGTTVAAGAGVLYRDGAEDVIIACPHAVFHTGVERALRMTPPIRGVTANTTPMTSEKRRLMAEGRLVVIDIRDWLGEALSRWIAGKSLGIMHEYDIRSRDHLGGDFEQTGQRGLVRWVFT